MDLSQLEEGMLERSHGILQANLVPQQSLKVYLVQQLAIQSKKIFLTIKDI